MVRCPLLFLLRLLGGAAAALAAASSCAQVVQLDPEVVTASRLAQPPAQAAATVRWLGADALRASPAATLDGALRAVPGFSLFRRSDSFSANPTAQGVSLRGLGPSGASRSLVLLDGVPLNDPFGGWVAWTKLPRESLQQVEVVPGGGATAWGNAALGGVLQVLAAAPEIQTSRAALSAGNFGTRSAEFAHTQPGRNAILDVAARVFATDGFALVAPERRGPIDVPAWSRHRWAAARWRQTLSPALGLTASFRTFEEKRGNGTPYQRNSSRENFGSLAFAGRPAATFAWSAVAYVQDQSFASTFSGVNAARTAETPASDQFAVPATAAGAAWSGTWKHADGARTVAGVDARFVRGETREHFTFVAGNFTRLRVAGGRQAVAGLFAVHERPLAAGLRATLGARLDRWRDTDGLRRESDRATGTLSRHDRYADLADNEISPNAGLVWQPAPAWRFRAHAQHAFRRPTLNELHRPFRVGANVTEANAALQTEHVLSAELGAAWSPAGTGLVLGAVAFANDFRDAVANVTLARGPGTFPLFGTLAAGATGRQRLNLDRTRVQGIELSARWSPRPALAFTADYLGNSAEVRRAAVAPALVGKRVAQVPRHSAAFGATWRAPGGIVVTPRLRTLGRQFEDDENQLRLGAVTIVDLGLSRPLTRHLELFVSAENLGRARIETGRSADGVVNTGTPRLIFGGVRGVW